MNTLHQFFFGIFPYIALAIFFFGSLVRFEREQYSWKSESSQLLYEGQLRLGNILFHVGVLAVFFGHLFLQSPHNAALSTAAVAEENLSLAENTERYQDQPDQPVKSVAQEPVSTFSIDVDTGSYANVCRFLTNGEQPPKDAVRIEEIVNYFPYNYPLPTDEHPFAVHTETIDSPWQPEAKLIKIGIQAQDTAKKDLPPANLVFLVDVSGSMDYDITPSAPAFTATT